MATFMEAMKAAREGKKLTLLGKYDRYEGYYWDRSHCGLVTNNGTAVCISQDSLDGNWIIEQPREYTFMEAVEMMEKGKVMRSIATGAICSMPDPIFSKPDGSNFVLVPCEVKGKWIEVTA